MAEKKSKKKEALFGQPGHSLYSLTSLLFDTTSIKTMKIKNLMAAVYAILGVVILIGISLLLWFFTAPTTVAILATVALIILMEQAAKNGVFLCHPPEGGVMVIMAGERVIKYVGFIPGHTIHHDTGEIIPNTDLRVVNGEVPPLKTFLGMIWIGLWPFRKIYYRHFTWMKVHINPTRFESRDEQTSILVWRYPYGMVLVVPTNDNIPIKVQIVVTARTTNASESLFGTRDFLTELSSSISATCRDVLGNFDYETIIESLAREGQNNFSELELVREIKMKATPVMKAIGQEIDMVDIITIVVDDPEHPIAKVAIEGLQARIEARKKAEAIREAIPGEEAQTRISEERKKQEILDGEAKAAVIEATGEAEARVLMAKIEAEREGLGVKPEDLAHLRKIEATAKAMENWTVEQLWVQGGPEGGVNPLQLVNIPAPAPGKAKPGAQNKDQANPEGGQQ